MPIPTSGWCIGSDSVLFDPEMNAICAPREVCEELCDSLDECVSFDMHRQYARCYLNFACDAEDEVGYPGYDVFEKGL